MKHMRDIVAVPVTHLYALYAWGRTFLLRDIWLIDPAATSPTRALVLRPLQVVLIVLRGFFWDHQCLLRSSALTYTTLLALVPMLAFMFAFLKGLGVQNMLEPWLIDKLSVGSADTIHLIIDYVNNIKVGTLGAIGLGSLLFSTILQLRTVEHTLNEIWGVRAGRPLLRQISDYVSVMVIAPVLLLLAITVNAALRNQVVVALLLKLPYIEDALVLMLTYVAVWGVFTFSYAFIPNTRVRLVPALLGGVVAGTLWHLTQRAYIDFQVGVSEVSRHLRGVCPAAAADDLAVYQLGHCAARGRADFRLSECRSVPAGAFRPLYQLLYARVAGECHLLFVSAGVY